GDCGPPRSTSRRRFRSVSLRRTKSTRKPSHGSSVRTIRIADNKKRKANSRWGRQGLNKGPIKRSLQAPAKRSKTEAVDERSARGRPGTGLPRASLCSFKSTDASECSSFRRCALWLALPHGSDPQVPHLHGDVKRAGYLPS